MIWLSNSTHRYMHKRTETICLHKTLYMNFHSCIIHNSQRVKTVHMSTDWWMIKQKVIYPHCCCWVTSSCPTLCDPIDCSPPGSPVPGTLQARTLEWAAISFSNAGKWKVKVKSLSRVRLSVTPWTAAYQAPPPMGFSRQEHWSGVPLPSPYTHTVEYYSPIRRMKYWCMLQYGLRWKRYST